MKRIWLSLILLLWSLPAAADGLSRLTIQTPQGPVNLEIELVNTPATRAQGLMHRTHLPETRGMLFDFITERPVSFWMKNTLIPLDMIFISDGGVITRIHRNAVPHDRTSIRSGGPVRAVLEINGGLARILGIQVGQTVSHFIFR